MAFALNIFQCWGQQVPVPINMPGYQHAYFRITGTTADVSLDFSNFTGTLWTALSSTTGGASAKGAMQTIQGQVVSLLDVQSQQLYMSRVKVAALTTTAQYTQTVTSFMPVIAVNAGDGETVWQILMSWKLSANNSGLLLDIPSAS